MSYNFQSGTVTFLFTDIEGSTKLWKQSPEEMLIAQARHNKIVREAIESNKGYVFQVIGDAFVQHSILLETRYVPQSGASWIWKRKHGNVGQSRYEWAYIQEKQKYKSQTALTSDT